MSGQCLKMITMNSIERSYRHLLEVCGLVAGILIGLVAILVTIDVAIRNLGIGNFPWAVEIAEYVLFVSTFLAAPWVLSLRAHVRVDIVPEALSRSAAQRLEIITGAIGVAISLVMFRYGITVTLDAWTTNSVIAKELRILEWALLSVIPFSAALLAVEFVRQTFSAIRLDPVSVGTSRPGGV